jgi:hypothetical protein
MSIEISEQLKLLLQAVDPAVDTAFSEGVTSSGDYLPALGGYDKIPPDLKPGARNGILATFAALVQQIAQPPVPANCLLENGWYNNGLAATYSRTVLNDVFLNGTVYSPGSVSNSIVVILPQGYRPQRDLYLPAMANTGLIGITITTAGAVILPPTTAGDWVSLDNIRFIAVPI